MSESADDGTSQCPTVASHAAMRAALEAYVDRINKGDKNGILALFAPDAVIEDPVGAPTRSGKAIETWFADTITFGTRIRPVAPIRGSHANAAALIFEVTFRPPDGPPMLIRSLDVCTFDGEGRITSLKAYWGPDDVDILPC
ncbi:nuclear transport factor 2 family protein [Sphingobium sp.]|uniref:nuclear transport factor 2 family protein n=1 Tax=Sphingobium sp. TaxID=1912891 RepID=UPI002B523EB6|nr:nuclear transport factor 2 family protein [Sphingobium sp.]HUD94935.1 nuclear transport factor 2 family protein [Sphingobium sp.]